MKRSELIELIYVQSDLSLNQCKEGVNLILETMMDSLANSRRIEIRDFASFDIQTKQARAAHNPKTGEKVTLPKRAMLRFRPGKALNERINTSKDEVDIIDN
ncbi:MAG: HU family DNA-binding protein [Proteobacteria bacterium]|nr:HU family DNA-binding protein [Pseudomonadota bacterium]